MVNDYTHDYTSSYGTTETVNTFVSILVFSVINDVYNYSVGTRHYEDSLQGTLLSLMIAITVQCNNL